MAHSIHAPSYVDVGAYVVITVKHSCLFMKTLPIIASKLTVILELEF